MALLKKLANKPYSLAFLAEWGPRSQLATMALAAAKNP
jgi:putative Ca2+/H+ antiporter (TMEM165/GDT1 family)